MVLRLFQSRTDSVSDMENSSLLRALRPRSAVELTSSNEDIDPGVAGNTRLTATAGLVLFVLFAIEGVTILRIRPLLSWHYFFGFLLIPPVLLKMASTGYRFMHYYGGDRRYRLSGPPQLLLRLIAPIVVVSTIVVFATGVELWIFGDALGREWRGLHQVSFVIWFFATAVHVLGYLGRAPMLAAADFRPELKIVGAKARQWLTSGSIVAGVLLAVATAQRLSPYIPEHFGR